MERVLECVADGESMKVLCPVCGVEGILEQRGNSSRVLHYKGFFDGKRVYERHAAKMGVNDGSNGNKQMGINTGALGIFNENKQDSRGCRLAWPRLVDLGSIDPGSNPGSPTIGDFLNSDWWRRSCTQNYRFRECLAASHDGQNHGFIGDRVFFCIT